MKINPLGRTGIAVSRLCFGSLTVGPLQKNMSVPRGADLILAALESGVNFIDTAEIYGTYPHIAEAVRRHVANGGERPVIATKSYSYDASGAAESLEKAKKELDTDVIDIFLLHEQESALTLRGHREASEYFGAQKAKGRIRAFGVSTHAVEVARASGKAGYIDVLHPIVNLSGLGILDGTTEEMLAALRDAYSAGIGIYAMKIFGGGNLLGSYRETLRFALNLPFVDSIAIGMQSEEELRRNLEAFESGEPGDAVAGDEKRLRIEDWCVRCGKCVERCGQNALSVSKDGKNIVADSKKCVLCGYCAAVCKDFAIKVY